MKHSFLRVWKYWHAKWSGHLEGKIRKESTKIKKSICHLDLNYFFVGVIKWLIHPPIVIMIIVLWNKEFNYYKELPLESTMVKHKLETRSSFRAKQMNSKTKDTIVDVQLTLLDQIYFLVCTYIMMWAIKKEEHA